MTVLASERVLIRTSSGFVLLATEHDQALFVESVRAAGVERDPRAIALLGQPFRFVDLPCARPGPHPGSECVPPNIVLAEE